MNKASRLALIHNLEGDLSTKKKVGRWLSLPRRNPHDTEVRALLRTQKAMAREQDERMQEASQQRPWPAASLVMLAASVGFAAWHAVPLVYVRPVLDKVMEELRSVDDTIHANLKQFSLVPFTEDGDEYRDAVESWSLHFQELSRMAHSALYGTIEESALPWVYAVFCSLAAAAAVGMLTCVCFSWAVRPHMAYLCTFCAAYSLAGVLSLSEHAYAMAAVNDGMAHILNDTSGNTMQALLDRSNADDEYLQLMLLTTGYLRRIDETPPWLCLPLPPPLHQVRHQTMSAYAAGYADAMSCIPVTHGALRLALLAAACVALVALLRQCLQPSCGQLN